ncbi:hypothetical protein F5883DRAFT_6588 [Diaporthe sp. PMI_573]|nr:hypothetical protein F5883DRAFT_6588 [Diaporthaceae sp. PMI_573]
MCHVNTFYGACGHSHMVRIRCKNKSRNSFFRFFTKSKPCFSIFTDTSIWYCLMCGGNEDRNRRDLQALARMRSRDSYIDAAANRRVAELPSFALQAPRFTVEAPQVDRQPPSQPQRPSHTTPLRSEQRLERSNARSSRPQRGESLHPPVESSRGRSRLPDPSPGPSSRPRVSPNIPRSITMHTENSDVSLVSVGSMSPRSVSPDELGRKPSHNRPRS